MTQEPGPHLDLDTVADLDAELLAPAEAAVAREHLAGCGQCSELLGRLRTTRGLLSAMPPEEIPADVAGRIDEALRHEQDAAKPRGTVVPIHRRRWNNAALAGAAAAVAVLVLIAAVVASSLHSNKGNDSASSTAGSAGSAAGRNSAPQAIKQFATGRDYTPSSIAALVPALLTATPPLSAARAPAAGGATSGSGAGSGTAAAPATPSPAPNSAAPNSAVGGTAGGTLSLDALQTSPQAVANCAQILGGSGTVPLAVDFARFQGKPAAVFVLPTPGHPESLDVWVVKRECSAASLDYYFRRVPRG